MKQSSTFSLIIALGLFRLNFQDNISLRYTYYLKYKDRLRILECDNFHHWFFIFTPYNLHRILLHLFIYFYTNTPSNSLIKDIRDNLLDLSDYYIFMDTTTTCLMIMKWWRSTIVQHTMQINGTEPAKQMFLSTHTGTGLF